MDKEENNVNVVISFLPIHKSMESEQGRYVFVDGEGYDVSNNLNITDLVEFLPFSITQHLFCSLKM